MKRTLLSLSVLLLVVLYINPLHAQEMSKDEKKRIKKIAKGYKKDPASYTRMIDSYDNKIETRDNEIEDLKAKLAALKSQCDGDLAEKDAKIAAMQKDLDEAMRKLANCSSGKLPETGTVYCVQVGYYNFFDVTKYFGTSKYLYAEATDEGGHKYMVTSFENPNDAKAAAEDIKKLGIKDAFVTKYVDGKRVDFDILKDGK